MPKVIQLKEIRNDFSGNIEKLIDLCKFEIAEISNLIIEKLDSDVP